MHATRRPARPLLPVFCSTCVELVCGLLGMSPAGVGQPMEHAGPEFLVSHDKGLTLIVWMAHAAARATLGLARARAHGARRFMAGSACISAPFDVFCINKTRGVTMLRCVRGRDGGWRARRLERSRVRRLKLEDRLAASPRSSLALSAPSSRTSRDANLLEERALNV